MHLLGLRLKKFIRLSNLDLDLDLVPKNGTGYGCGAHSPPVQNSKIKIRFKKKEQEIQAKKINQIKQKIRIFFDSFDFNKLI